jgi:hypothetical protein
MSALRDFSPQATGFRCSARIPKKSPTPVSRFSLPSTTEDGKRIDLLVLYTAAALTDFDGANDQNRLESLRSAVNLASNQTNIALRAGRHELCVNHRFAAWKQIRAQAS